MSPTHDNQPLDLHDSEAAKRLQKVFTCLDVADMVGLKGKGPTRHCPVCQEPPGRDAPALAVGLSAFDCYKCRARGDLLDLVQLTLRCGADQAVAFLEAQAKVRGARTRAAPDPSGDTSIDPLAALNAGSGELNAIAAQGQSPASNLVNLESDQPTITSDEADTIFRAFLAGCRKPPDHVLAVLKQWGITAAGLEKLQIHYYSHDYENLLNRLAESFGLANLNACGLMRAYVPSPQRKRSEESAALPPDPCQGRGLFAAYHQAKVPYLVIPYICDGQILALKARPLADVSRLNENKLPRSIATTRFLRWLYNGDELSNAPQVLLFRRELDVAVACSLGLPAIACPAFAHFKAVWAKQLAGKKVYLIAEPADANQLEPLFSMFDGSSLPRPQVLQIPTGVDLADFLRQNVAMEILAPPEDGVGSSIFDTAIRAFGRQEKDVARDGGERFIAALPIGNRRTLCLHLFHQGGRPLLRCRYWLQNKEGRWEQDSRSTLVVPQDYLQDLISALGGAVRGQSVTEEPSFLRAPAS